MSYGACTLALIPMRAEPDDRSEMVNQVLFGETFGLTDERKKWVRIKLTHDGYEGWIDRKQFTPVEETTALAFNGLNQPLAHDLVDMLAGPDGHIPIVLGTPLPNLANGKVHLDGSEWGFDGASALPELSRPGILENAFMYLNSPYLWGGRSPFGIDCSGFTQMAYRLGGMSLPRDAWQQAEMGETLSFIEESEPGDLAFFDNEEGRIIHVGIILENNYILHASGKVRLDRLDQSGIYNAEIRAHTHRLRVIKKLF